MQQINHLVNAVKNALSLFNGVAGTIAVIDNFDDSDEVKELVASGWGYQHNYALHYFYDGVSHISYFRNAGELMMWQHLYQTVYPVTKNRSATIINLYMWDFDNGPVVIEDIVPHFKPLYN